MQRRKRVHSEEQQRSQAGRQRCSPPAGGGATARRGAQSESLHACRRALGPQRFLGYVVWTEEEEEAAAAYIQAAFRGRHVRKAHAIERRVAAREQRQKVREQRAAEARSPIFDFFFGWAAPAARPTQRFAQVPTQERRA